MEPLYYSRMNSPVGPLEIAVSERGLVSIAFCSFGSAAGQYHSFRWIASEEKTAPCREQLSAYFAGTRREFDLPIDLRAGTDFQRHCWDALLRIPYGETRSYLDIAHEVGRPGASRAVGQANHHNPVAIVIPCHRVITSAGQLGGYGGGLEMKDWLLRREGVRLPCLSQGVLAF